jgi:hypothetical protein
MTRGADLGAFMQSHMENINFGVWCNPYSGCLKSQHLGVSSLDCTVWARLTVPSN